MSVLLQRSTVLCFVASQLLFLICHTPVKLKCWSRADWRASAPADSELMWRSDEAASSAADSELMYLHNIKSQTVTQLTVSDNQQGARRHRGVGADAWSRADCLVSAPAEAASSAADGVDVPG
mgnify:CR=1 FL=1